MIPDSQTNKVYFSDLLPKRFPALVADLTRHLERAGVAIGYIQGTRDIWCRDYMPVQVDVGRFVQFRYQPDYLRDDADSITPPEVCRRIPEIEHCVESDIVLDGGNVVHWADKAIMTDKIYRENPGYRRPALRKKLKDLLGLDELIIIPQEPEEALGHADGVVRFIDADRVLVNDYSQVDPDYGARLLRVLRRAGLECVEITYAPNLRSRAKIPPASGCYTNFLRVQGAVIIPVFLFPEDEIAVDCVRAAHLSERVVVVDAHAIAKEGGILNCATWSITIGNESELC